MTTDADRAEAREIARRLFRYEEIGKPGPFPVFLSPLEFVEKIATAIARAKGEA